MNKAADQVAPAGSEQVQYSGPDKSHPGADLPSPRKDKQAGAPAAASGNADALASRKLMGVTAKGVIPGKFLSSVYPEDA